jgi:hypothetical protein
MAGRLAAGFLVVFMLTAASLQYQSAATALADSTRTELSQAASPHDVGAQCTAHQDADGMCCMTGTCHGIAGLPWAMAVSAPRAIVEATRYSGALVSRRDGCPIRPTPPPPRTEV